MVELVALLIMPLVGVLGIFVAIWNIFKNKEIAKVRHTLDFLLSYNSDKRIDKACAFIRDIEHCDAAEAIKKYEEENNREYFLFIMNQFEILAIGLFRGVYDKKLINKSFGFDLYYIYQKVEVLIQHIRKEDGDDRGFSEFEKLTKESEKLANQIDSEKLTKQQPAISV